MLQLFQQAEPKQLDQATYKEKDFPSFEEVKEFRLSEEDYKDFKELFLGRSIPPQRFSDLELASRGYNSWPRYCLQASLANT